MPKRPCDSNEEPPKKMSKSNRESLRRHRLQMEYNELRTVIEDIEPRLDVKMEQADILEQARKLIKKLQNEALELKTRLLLAESQKVQAFNVGREAFSIELLLTQIASYTKMQHHQQQPPQQFLQPPYQQPLQPSSRDDDFDQTNQPSSSN